MIHIQKILLSCIFLAIISFSQPLSAANSVGDGNNGIGLAIGAPLTSGITYYRKLNDNTFVEAFFRPRFMIGADYALSFPHAVYAMPEVTPYVGGGAFVFISDSWMRHEDDSGVGVRMPFGIIVKPSEAPLHFFVEIAPLMALSPASDTFLEGLLGARFLF